MRVGVFALMLGIVTVIGSYILAFRGNRLSSDPKDWAEFASYLGGTLGTLLSLLALGALYLTYLQQNIASRESELSGLFQQLSQSVQGCHRELKAGGILSGQAYFEEYGREFWTNYVRCCNEGMSGDEANWISIRSQTEFIATFIGTSTTLTEPERVQAMARLKGQLTSGIATLLAVDIHLRKRAELTKLAEKYGLLQAVEEGIRDSLSSDHLYAASAFH